MAADGIENFSGVGDALGDLLRVRVHVGDGAMRRPEKPSISARPMHHKPDFVTARNCHAGSWILSGQL